ncbi:MAG: hypothetical protein JOZ68_00255 [Acidimicrobiia bacterium]|nr:hypothetical protein [Acidimicrobiia bacterium]
MVIVAFVLVLLAAATFAAGIAASRTSDTLVYISIIFSLAAFVTLAIASLRARQAEREEGAEDIGTQRLRSLDETEAHAGPLLGGLDPAQLDMSPSWRRQQRARWEVAHPVADDDEELEEQLENEEDEADLEVPVAPVAAAKAGGDLAWGFDDEDDDEAEEQEPTAAYTPVIDEDILDDDDLEDFETFEDDEFVDLPEPEPEPELEPEPEPVDSSQAAFFDQYDDLTAAEIVPFLSVLDRDGLQWVRARERSGAKRVTVLNKAEQLLGNQGARAPRASTRKKTPAKKAAAARRTTKSATKTTRRR